MLSRLSVRYASSEASATARRSSKVLSEQTVTTSSGLTVASLERNGAVAHLVLAFRAGSRYESVSQKGLSHHMRNFAGRDSQKYLGVPLLWSTASIGATLTSFTTRDIYGVRMSVPRESAGVALSILGHVAAQPSFKPWELEEILPTIVADNAYKQPFDVVFEDIHRAAYRNGGLGNSIFAAKRHIGNYREKELLTFASKHLVSGQGILFGVNVDHDQIVAYGENHIPVESGIGATAKVSPYIGGEVRRDSSEKFAHVILAGAGASSSDVSSLATQAVLLSILGQGTLMKFGGKIGNGALSKAVSGNGAVSAFQASYKDSGLIGAYLISEAATVGVAVRAIVSTLKNLKIDDIKTAKSLAASNILSNSDNSSAYSIDRSAQLLSGLKEYDVLSAIEKVSNEDVERAGKKFISKLSIASFGNIDYVPYLDQLATV